MKSVFFLADVKDIFEILARLLLIHGGDRVGHEVAQIIDSQGRALTVFPSDKAYEQEVTEPPIAIRGTPPSTSLSGLSWCVVECRWEDIILHWIQQLAPLTGGLWVLDGDGVLWNSNDLVAGEIRL
ncbi:hypothetical protein [Leifsonia sp. LS-T14]|uniref:hypothetical protein n=1 Tax=unclassified Leifsonia TaxID=2663824 RepID=UPI0035A6B92E